LAEAIAENDAKWAGVVEAHLARMAGIEAERTKDKGEWQSRNEQAEEMIAELEGAAERCAGHASNFLKLLAQVTHGTPHTGTAYEAISARLVQLKTLEKTCRAVVQSPQLQRFDLDVGETESLSQPYARMNDHAKGKYVLFEDHERALVVIKAALTGVPKS
jgi:hypothetical protein